MQDYFISIFYSEEDDGYITDIPDLRFCSAFGETPEEALREVQIAKTAWLEASLASGKPIPKPQYPQRFISLLLQLHSLQLNNIAPYTTMPEEKLHPVHPSEVLLEELLKPMGLSQNRLALDIGVHPRRINEIVLEKRRITADTALRLARYFDVSSRFWFGLQADYDLDVAAEALGDRLEREVRVYVAP
jgi:antitoxin HigA-1